MPPSAWRTIALARSSPRSARSALTSGISTSAWILTRSISGMSTPVPRGWVVSSFTFRPWRTRASSLIVAPKVAARASEPRLDLCANADAAAPTVGQPGQPRGTCCRIGGVVPARRRHVDSEFGAIEEPGSRGPHRRQRELDEPLRLRSIGPLLHVAGFRHQLDVLGDRVGHATASGQLGVAGDGIDGVAVVAAVERHRLPAEGARLPGHALDQAPALDFGPGRHRAEVAVESGRA